MSFEIDREKWEEFRNEIAKQIIKHAQYPYILQDIAIGLSDDVHRVFKVHHEERNIQGTLVTVNIFIFEINIYIGWVVSSYTASG